MKRQLRKVIFLPANRTVLFDTEVTEKSEKSDEPDVAEVAEEPEEPDVIEKIEEPKEPEVIEKSEKTADPNESEQPKFIKFFKSVINSLFGNIFSKKIKEKIQEVDDLTKIRSVYYRRFKPLINTTDYENIWYSIVEAKKIGYEVILFPEYNNDLTKEEIETGWLNMKEKGLAIKLMEGNSLSDFEKVIQEYNINQQNSIFISSDCEIIDDILQGYYLINSFSEDNNIPKRHFCLHFAFLNSVHQKRKSKFHVEETSSIASFVLLKTITEKCVYSDLIFPNFTDKVIFIEEKFSPNINNFIQQNIKWIEDEINARGCSQVVKLHL